MHLTTWATVVDTVTCVEDDAVANQPNLCLMHSLKSNQILFLLTRFRAMLPRTPRGGGSIDTVWRMAVTFINRRKPWIFN